MPTRNVSLTERWDRFVDERIRSGQYANASEVIRAGLSALDHDEKEDEAKIKALNAALAAGEESGVYEGDVFAEMEERITRRAQLAGKR
jgi:antitoxin ParD1/3/4